jgi:hypothetical protein
VQTVTKQAFASAVILSSVLMLASAYYWPIQDPYHPLNTGWNGCSKIALATPNVTIVSSYTGIEIKPPAVLAIIGPGLKFSQQDVIRIRSFMDGGGVVLLADGFGTGNSLLQWLNMSVRISGEPLADLVYYSKNPDFPIVSDFSPNPLTSNITALVFNHPSYLEIGNSTAVTPLAFSSPFSFVDANGTASPVRNETIESYPVIASSRIGGGLLVIVSDAGFLTNEMIDLYGNMRLFENALHLGNGSLLVDEAHLRKAPFTDARAALKGYVNTVWGLLEHYPAAQFVPVVIIASVMMIALWRMRRHVKSSTLLS